MKYVMNTRNHIFTVFDSIEDLVDQAFCCHDPEQFATRCNPTIRYEGDFRQFCVKQADRLKGRERWVLGVRDRRTTLDLLENPPDWMVERAHECLDQIQTAIAKQHEGTAPRRKRLRGLEDGDTLMLERVMTRHPEPWERMHRPAVPHKIVRIMVNPVTSAGEDKLNLVYRGAAAVASAMQIEEQGGKAEIWAGNCVSDGTTAFGAANFSQLTLVKPANEPTTISRTLATVAHLGFFRCVMLNAFQNSAKTSAEGHAYGRCADISKPVLDHVKPDVMIDWKDTSLTAACAAVSRSIEAAEAA
jgi:hypothetical protein